MGIRAERGSGQCDGGTEANGGTYHAGHETDGWMVRVAQEVIFPAILGHPGGQLCIAHGTHERHQAPDPPKKKDREGLADIQQLEAKAGEHTILTIEGNTSGTGSQANGGQVMMKTRKLGPHSFVVGYGRPSYKGAKHE